MSPTFLSQRVTVPSLTLSPRAGIVITVPAVDVTGVLATEAETTGAATTGAATTGAETTGAATMVADAPSAITASSAPTGTV